MVLASDRVADDGQLDDAVGVEPRDLQLHGGPRGVSGSGGLDSAVEPEVCSQRPGKGQLLISVWMMRGDEHKIVGRRLREILG